MTPARPRWRNRWLFRAPAYLYRWHCGWLLGHRFMLLIHFGRRTGKRYETVLEVMEYRQLRREAVVMSASGRNAHWLRNIEVASAQAVIGGERCEVAHRILEPGEAARVLAGYERRNRLAAPLIRLVLGRLVGWPYHGSDAERTRMVAELPLIAFRPR